MPLEIRKLMPHFAAEVKGIDIRERLSPTELAELRAAINEYGVVVLAGQDVDDEQQLAFTRCFGPVETSHAKSDYVTVRPDVVRVTNVDPITNQIMPAADKRMAYRDANSLWHSDSSFKKVPVVFSMLSAREVPPSGADTQFADMRIVWDELAPEERAFLERQVAEHSILHSKRQISPDAGEMFFSEEEKKKNPPVSHPLVLRHAETGRKAIYVGSHTSHILGLPVEEGRAIIRRLLDTATRTERIYRHEWRPHDLVIWDNRSVVHRATPFESQVHRRTLIRTMVAGKTTSEEQTT